MNPVVSILVPVFNVEKYLQECLDSLASQTLQDIEIIVVNDGSTDSSGDILERYCAADERMVLIDKENTGYGDSMNRALAVARGEYVGIVEPDDFVEPDMFQQLVSAALKHAADLVKCNYYEHRGSNGGRSRADDKVRIYEEFGIPYDTPFSPYDRPEVITVRPCIWAGLYRAAWLRDNGIDFAPTPGASFQDTSFAQMCWMAAETAVIVRKHLLHYRVDNAGSSVKSGDKVFAICDEYERSLNFMSDRGDRALVAFGPTFNAMKYCSYAWNYNRITPDHRLEFAERWSAEMLQAENAGMVNRGMLKPRDQHDLDVLMVDPQEFCRRHADDIVWEGYRVEGWSELPQTRLVVSAQQAARQAGESEQVGDLDSQQPIDDARPDITVIVPLYNVEEYVRECVESLVRQTFHNFEAIMVDDGSTDLTPGIARLVAGDDARFKLYSKPNGGLSSSRNFGIEKARGRYLLFLDSDDYLADNTFELLYARAQADDLDYLDFTAHSFYETKKARRLRDESYFETRPVIPGVMSGPELFIEYQNRREYICSACFHFFDRSLLDADENHGPLRFKEGIIHEDELFSPLLIARAKRAAYLPEALYQRRVREDSIITAKRGMKNIVSMYAAQKGLKEYAESDEVVIQPLFRAAMCQRVAELREIIAEDAMQVSDEELETHMATLDPAERVEFDIVALQGGRSLAVTRSSFEYRLSQTLLVVPRFFKYKKLIW